MALRSINPATGETLATFDTLQPPEVTARVERASAAFRSWKRTPFDERARYLARAADILDGESEQLGRLMTLEMGKPLRAGIDEAQKCARGCRYYAAHGAHFLADEHVPTEAWESYIRYEPLGVVLAVMP
jgi:succinate-semialdehyde dehydrogenase/glutarate-semialdehyde dehydrogenase